MIDWTADQLSQRIFDLRLLDGRQLDAVWTEFRTREIALEEFKRALLGKGLLTNFQLDKVLKGERDGYYYGKYRVLYMVGAGTFARVYRSTDTDNGRVVAVKVLRRRFRNEPAQVELFLREARMGIRLTHPNIVRVFDVSDDIRAPYMVMEFVEGQTLREFVKQRKKFDVATSLSLMIDIVSGLEYAISQGTTHRDMKLSNILITSKGKAKLVDFGLATIAEGTEKNLAAAPNARAIDYVALERGTGVRKNDPRSDIYFAGCIMYHLLTGVAPLIETRDRLVRMNISRFEDIKPILSLAPEVPTYVAAIVNRAITLQPNNRYQEPGEMLVELKQAERRFTGNEDTDAAAGTSGVNLAAGGGETAPAPDPSLSMLGEQEGRGRSVMLIESQMELQNLLRDQLKKRGYRVLITGDPMRAIDRFASDSNTADVALFSTQELGGQAVVAFNKLLEIDDCVSKPAILLVDSRDQGLVAAAKTNDHRVLMAMPMKVKDLRVILQKLLAQQK